MTDGLATQAAAYARRLMSRSGVAKRDLPGTSQRLVVPFVVLLERIDGAEAGMALDSVVLDGVC